MAAFHPLEPTAENLTPNMRDSAPSARAPLTP
jgi:hypothetical protein